MMSVNKIICGDCLDLTMAVYYGILIICLRDNLKIQNNEQEKSPKKRDAENTLSALCAISSFGESPRLYLRVIVSFVVAYVIKSGNEASPKSYRIQLEKMDAIIPIGKAALTTPISVSAQAMNMRNGVMQFLEEITGLVKNAVIEVSLGVISALKRIIFNHLVNFQNFGLMWRMV